MLDEATQLDTVDGVQERLDLVLSLPLTNYVPETRVTDRGLLQSLLSAAPCALSDLDRVLGSRGISRINGRATIAWLLKYDLLRVTAIRPDR